MRFLVQRQLPDRDGTADDPAPPVSPPSNPVNYPVVISLTDGPVCVTIIDEPHHPSHDNACRCGGCRSSIDGEWADRFLP